MDLSQTNLSKNIKILPKGLISLLNENKPNDLICITSVGLYDYFGKKNLQILNDVENLGITITNELSKVASLHEQKNTLGGSRDKTAKDLSISHEKVNDKKDLILSHIENLLQLNTCNELDKATSKINLEIEDFVRLLKEKLTTLKSKTQLDNDFEHFSSEITSSRSQLDKMISELQKKIVSYLEFEGTNVIPLAENYKSAKEQIIVIGEKALNTHIANVLTKTSPLLALLSKRFKLIVRLVKMLEKLIEEYKYKKIIKSDIIKTKKLINQISTIDLHLNDNIGAKFVYENMPSSLNSSQKQALAFYTDYITRLYEENCPSGSNKVVKSQSNDRFLNAITTAINSLSLLF